MSELDLSFMQAQPIFTLQTEHIALYLVGTGGTGSYLARHIARLAWLLQTRYRKTVSVTFIDPDTVETANVLRQDFCTAEIGLPKARCLALRYTGAFGIEIRSVVERFHRDMLTRSHWNTLSVVISGVDNAAARQALSEILEDRTERAREVPKVWWLDCGNTVDAGQILLGTTNNGEELVDAFKVPGVCRKLPSPIAQHPELLVPLPEELSDHNLSCEQFLIANVQSLMVNQQVAAYAAEMLYELLITQRLKRFATYFHQPSGTAMSKYITPEVVAQVVGKESVFFTTTSPQPTPVDETENGEEEEYDEDDL